MKNFEKINGNNVDLVKGAILNKKAIIILEEVEPKKGVENHILEDFDVYSLYDHPNLIIYRIEDSYFIGKLEKFYMKDRDNVVVVASTPSRAILREKLKRAGYDSDSEMFIKMEELFEKADQLQKELDDQNKLQDKLDEYDEEEESIFDIFDDDEEEYCDNDNKPKSIIEILVENMPHEMKKDFERYKRSREENLKKMREKSEKEINDFIKEKRRNPNAEELLDIIVNISGLPEALRKKVKKDIMSDSPFRF